MVEHKHAGQVSGGEQAADERRARREVVEQSGKERMDAEGGAQDVPSARKQAAADEVRKTKKA